MYLIVLLIQFHAAVMNKFWNTAYLTLIPCVDRKWRVVQFCFSSGRSRNANIFSQLCCNCCSLSDAYLLKYLGCLDEFLMSLLPCCIIFSTEIVQFCIWIVVIQYTSLKCIHIVPTYFDMSVHKSRDWLLEPCSVLHIFFYVY
jgi:hypothetical protein